jgi:hypothetical protein
VEGWKAAEVDMVERLNEMPKSRIPEPFTQWGDGVYHTPCGSHLFIKGGVLHLPSKRVDVIRLLTWPKPWQVVVMGGETLIFLRARDVLAEWPHMTDQVNRIAALCGASL